MYEKLDACPLCKHEDQENFLITKDYTVSGEDFVIVRCTNCDFHFTNPRPSSDSLDKYYESEDYISHQDKGNSLINRVYKFARMFTLNSKLKLVSKYCTSGELLDIGCGTGHFLEVCNKAGYSTFGVEPNDQARDFSKSKNIGNIYSDISEISSNEQTFDIITLWHVLEHIPDLENFTNRLKSLLSKNGILFIAVPNLESYDAKYYQQHWAAYDVPRHLYHFSQITMRNYLNINGFKHIKTIPMKLDSYYVSLLSEKYKNNGKNNYIKSIITGFKSNTYALKNNNNFSSLIYIAKFK